MTIQLDPGVALAKAQADVGAARTALADAQAAASAPLTPHGAGVTAIASARAQQVIRAQTALITAQTAERAAQRAVDDDHAPGGAYPLG